MTLPVSGPISIGLINTTLGRGASATSSMGETALRTLAGVPSGVISMSNFHGKKHWVLRTGNLVTMTGLAAPAPFTCVCSDGSWRVFDGSTAWSTNAITSVNPSGTIFLNTFNNSNGIILQRVTAFCGASDVRNCTVTARTVSGNTWITLGTINPGVGHNEATWASLTIPEVSRVPVNAIAWTYVNNGVTARLSEAQVVEWFE